MIPRQWLAAVLAGAVAFSVQGTASAQVPAWSQQAQQRLLAGPDAARALAERQRLVQLAETQLAAGATDAAEAAFDQAALLVHSPDVEIGLVRTYLQAGDYSRALGFASHAAGAHRDVPAGTALYAWLLHLGGQGVYARRLLAEALARTPGDVAVLSVQAQLATDWPRPDTALLQPPLRAAPYATGAVPPPKTRVVGTAVLAGDGASALAAASLVPPAGRLWVRNGLGQTAEATVVQQLAGDARLVVLRLHDTLPLPAALAASPRAPFAGSPGTLVEYGVDPTGAPAWPMLRQGFLGRDSAGPGGRQLGIATPAGPRGGPVFDAFGRIAGIALADPDGSARLVPITALAAGWPDPAAAPGLQMQHASLDGVYTSALRVALQLLVAD